MTSFHPELASRARWLPRGVGRRWAVPVVRTLERWGYAWARSRGVEVDLEGGGSAFVVRPEGAGPHPALLWIHGGGLLFGDARQDEPLAQRVVDEFGAVVASVQYRCGPRHPFPTPLDDCARAYRWLAAQPDVDPAQIVVGGASAGGGLAAALCQRLRDAGGVQPCAQLLVYPMLDDRSSDRAHEHDPWFRLWDRPSNLLGWGTYLAGHDRASPPLHAVPARTEDLAGLPPAWIGVGTLDLFHDEDLAYAARLRAAGVAADVEVVAGAYHAFDALDAGAPVSRGFRDAQLAALGGAWSARR